MNKLSKYASLPFQDKILFLEALGWLILAKLILLLLPFRRILPLLRQKSSRETVRSDINVIKTALGRASAATPWLSTCLLKSIAARWMLKQRKIASHMAIGMGRDEKNRLLMHAWITSGNIEIVSKDNDFTELYVFE
ncbi:MAG: lasso peptide biosynthesis B2 protein [Bacteroidota bacterium]